ncbi:MAG: RNA methyltransferase, partial [Chloroflexota bacterium]
FQCANPTCALRLPIARRTPAELLICPRCKSPLQPVATISQVRSNIPNTMQRSPLILEALLDNIRSTFNIGAIFRTADGAGLQHLHLCGITPLPGDPRISKTALGAERAVSWSYHANGYQIARTLIESGAHLWALETNSKACSLFEATLPPDCQPLVVVVGNEVSGVDPGILDLCEQSIWIPMAGYKRSLNVAVAFGIAVYHLMFAGRRQLTGSTSEVKIDPQPGQGGNNGTL